MADLKALERRMRDAIAAWADTERGCPVVSAWRVKEWADELAAIVDRGWEEWQPVEIRLPDPKEP